MFRDEPDLDFSNLPVIELEYTVPEDDTSLFLVPAARLPYLLERIKKLQSRQKRLAKVGPLADAALITVEVTARQLRPPRCIFCGHDQVPAHYNDGRCKYAAGYWRPGSPRVYYLCRVEGPRAKLADWEFIATLQHEDAGTILRAVPGAEIAEGELDRFRNVKPHCEHCNARRYRKDSFVVRHDDGTLRQVGRTCLGKYLGGGVDPKAIARLAELLIEARGAADEEPELGWGSGGPLVGPISDFLIFVAACIRLEGWLPRSKAGDDEVPTADRAWALQFPWSQKGREEAERFRNQIEDRDVELAQAALDCVRRELNEHNTRSDYEHNLRVACAADVVKGRTAGLAASVVTWYERRLVHEQRRQAAQRAARRAAKHSEHVGAVGDMINVVVTVRGISDGFTDYGAYHFHRFVDVNDNNIIWRSTRERLEVGATYELRGKIKEHGEWKGIKQTQLTRCRVLNKIDKN